MNQKIKQISSEEQLLQARERGLQEASQIEAMKARGKVLGMDVFSWINPQLDHLATVISSFPFMVHWAASHQQAKTLLDNYPELALELETLIIYDHTTLDVAREVLNEIPTIVCLEGLEGGLHMLKAMSRGKSVFLFTAQQASSKQSEALEQFLDANR